MLKHFISESFSLDPNTTDILIACLDILWNATDCSEKIVERLLDIPNLKEYISVIIRKTDYSTRPGLCIVNGAINIVNNIIRRDKYRSVFDDYNLSSTIFQVLQVEGNSANIDLVLAFMICFLLPWDNKAKRQELLTKFGKDIVRYVDGVSHTADFRYECFSSQELLDMLLVSSRESKVRDVYCANAALKEALVRLLGKNHKIDLIVSIIEKLFDQNAIRKIQTMCVSGKVDKSVVDLLRKLR